MYMGNKCLVLTHMVTVWHHFITLLLSAVAWMYLSSSFAQSCPALCDPMDCSTPAFPVIQYLLEFSQIHVHCVNDAIQPSHPPLPSSPPAFNVSQHQGLFLSRLFTLESQSIGASASVLPMNIQGWFPLGLTGLITLLSKELSRVFFSTALWKHQFFGAQPSL